MERSRTVLLIDDDPIHLQIYGWLLRSAGFDAYPALFVGDSVQLPSGQPIDVVILDYRTTGQLNLSKTTSLIRKTFPAVPIILLADTCDSTDAVVRATTTFVRKGQPDKLIAAIHAHAE